MNKILIFAKTPIIGMVKTRLKKNSPFNDEDINTLYTAFLKDTINSATNSDTEKIYISYFPESSQKVMEQIVSQVIKAGSNKTKQINLIPQIGENFSERLNLSLKKIKKHGDSVAIIGSDAPTITPVILDESFSCLSSNGSMVLGPSGEGGVYLIGLKLDGEFLFDDVFEKDLEIVNLTKKCKQLKLSLSILEELTDVDIQADLITTMGNLYALKYSSLTNRNIFLPKYTIEALNLFSLSVHRRDSGTREKYMTY